MPHVAQQHLVGINIMVQNNLHQYMCSFNEWHRKKSEIPKDLFIRFIQGNSLRFSFFFALFIFVRILCCLADSLHLTFFHRTLPLLVCANRISIIPDYFL